MLSTAFTDLQLVCDDLEANTKHSLQGKPCPSYMSRVGIFDALSDSVHQFPRSTLWYFFDVLSFIFGSSLEHLFVFCLKEWALSLCRNLPVVLPWLPVEASSSPACPRPRAVQRQNWPQHSQHSQQQNVANVALPRQNVTIFGRLGNRRISQTCMKWYEVYEQNTSEHIKTPARCSVSALIVAFASSFLSLARSGAKVARLPRIQACNTWRWHQDVKKSWKILENRGKSIKKSWKIVVKCSDASTSNHLLACEEIRTYQDNSWEELVKQSVSPMASSWNLLKHVETSGHTHSSQAKFRASTLWRSTSTENVEKMSRCPENDIHVICHVICYDDLWWSAMSRKWSLSLSRLLSSHWVLIAFWSIRLTEVCHLVVCRSRVLPEAWRPTRSSALSTQCTCYISLSNRYLVVI